MVNFLFTDNVHLAPISEALLVQFINKLLKVLSSEMDPAEIRFIR